MAGSQAPPKGKSSGGLAAFKRKIGPQPMWAWMAETLGVALAYALYKQRKTAAAQPTTSGATTVPSDQVPDVIIENGLPDNYRTHHGPSTTGPTVQPAPLPAPTPTPVPMPKPGPEPWPGVPPGWVPPVQPPPNAPPGGGWGGKSTYKTNGKQTLAQIAKQLGVTPQVLIADTIDHPGNVNGGKFAAWLQKSKMGAAGHVPAGLTLYYTPGQK